MERKAYVFGSNREGQLGVSYGDDCAFSPVEVGHVEGKTISRVSLNQHQTFIIQDNGVLLSAGANDSNELGRSGKRSLFHRVDALETFQVCEASIGAGFFNLLTDDGRVVSWGMNDLGQLGNNTRDNKDKPRVNTAIQEPILQIASGATHSIALTKSGRVITWGGNRWGQLGDGQLTSSTKIHVPLQLRHRPVVSVVCGENHSLVMTVGGNVYGWGENTQGQLGLSDTTNRLRPEQIKALRSMGATKIAAGRNHSLVISQTGLVLAFGSNNHGQCGVDSEVKIQPQPIVVERLRELRAVDVSGGFAHTMVLCEVPGSAMARVYVMGLNSSGQLGLGSTASQSTPTLLTLPDPTACPIGTATGPMAMHSLVLTALIPADKQGHTIKCCNPLRQQALPAVHLDKVASLVLRFKDAHRVNPVAEQAITAFTKVREMISAAFSSIPVLNASFLLPAEQIGHGSLCVDLKAVRSAYDHIMSTEPLDPLGVVTLGRATLHLAEQLKECPVDDAENLSVFLIALENPLMLRASSFHVAIELVIRGILSIPKYYRLILFKWLKSYPSEYFGRVLQVLQGFLTLILTNKALKLDPTPVVLVLETLYQCNLEEKIVPESLFYNEAVPRTVRLQKEWILFRSQSFNSSVFNYCSYPFLVPELHKLNLLRFEFKNQQDMQVALSHRNLPIVAYLHARVALLAAAGHAMQHQQQLQQQLQQQQQQSAVSADREPQVSSHGATPSTTFTTSSTSTDSTTAAATSSSTTTSTTTSTSTTSSTTHTVTSTSTTSSASNDASVDPPSAQSRAPAPPPAATLASSVPPVTSAPSVISFLSSAQVDAAIQQALPYLPAGVAQQVVQLPAGVNISYDILDGLVANIQLWLEISVDRNRLLPDLIEQLDAILKEDSNTLFLPLKVSFKGEIGVDYGGVKREFFTIAIKEILAETNLLGTCANGNMVWFTDEPLKATPLQRQNSSASYAGDVSSASGREELGPEVGPNEAEDSLALSPHNPRKLARLASIDGAVDPGSVSSNLATVAVTPSSPLSASLLVPGVIPPAGGPVSSPRSNKYEHFVLSSPLAYYLGLLVGLAAYNEVHVDVPLPPCVYKIIKGEELILTDLWAVDSSLAAGLQALLSFEEGAGSIEDIFAVTFTASANPLLNSSLQPSGESEKATSSSSRYVELIPGGEDILVTRSNRAQFVKSFVQHALHGSVAAQIAEYIQGLHTCFQKAALQMCSSGEIEHILCGSKEIGDLQELRPGTTYKGNYTDKSPIVGWFWDYLSSLSLSDKRKFLHFVTGSERAPLGGLSNLKLTVQSIAQAENALPTSHTCFNILNIPDSYGSAEQLKNRFTLALKYHEGFGLV